MLIILAFIAFLAAAIWFGITRAFPMVLLAAGLALWALDAADLLRAG